MKRLIEQSSAAAVKLQHEAMKQMAEATEAAKAKAPNAAQLCIAAQQAAGKAQEMAECRLAGISAPQRKRRAAASHCRWCAIVCHRWASAGGGAALAPIEWTALGRRRRSSCSAK